MYSDAFLADTRIDADAVNTVTIKAEVESNELHLLALL